MNLLISNYSVLINDEIILYILDDNNYNNTDNNVIILHKLIHYDNNIIINNPDIINIILQCDTYTILTTLIKRNIINLCNTLQQVINYSIEHQQYELIELLIKSDYNIISHLTYLNLITFIKNDKYNIINYIFSNESGIIKFNKFGNILLYKSLKKYNIEISLLFIEKGFTLHDINSTFICELYIKVLTNNKIRIFKILTTIYQSDNIVDNNILECFIKYPINKILHTHYINMENIDKLKIIYTILLLCFKNYDDKCTIKFIKKFIKIYKKIEINEIAVDMKNNILNKIIVHNFIKLLYLFIEYNICIDTKYLCNINSISYNDTNYLLFEKLSTIYNHGTNIKYECFTNIITTKSYNLFQLFKNETNCIFAIELYINYNFYNACGFLTEENIINKVYLIDCDTFCTKNLSIIDTYNVLKYQDKLFALFNGIINNGITLHIDFIRILNNVIICSKYANNTSSSNKSNYNLKKNIILLLSNISSKNYKDMHINLLGIVAKYAICDQLTLDLFVNNIHNEVFRAETLIILNNNIKKYLIYDFRFWKYTTKSQRNMLFMKYINIHNILLLDIINKIFNILIFNYE